MHINGKYSSLISQRNRYSFLNIPAAFEDKNIKYRRSYSEFVNVVKKSCAKFLKINRKLPFKICELSLQGPKPYLWVIIP